MRIFAAGREIDVPTDENGNVDVVEVRRAANIPDDRSLIQQRSSGENFVLPRSGQVNINLMTGSWGLREPKGGNYEYAAINE